MQVSDFDFNLPPDLIARQPLPARDASRLLVYQRESATRTDSSIRDLPRWLRSGDLLVLNATRVTPARLEAVRASTGGRVEILLCPPEAPPDAALAAGVEYPLIRRALTRSGGKLRVGEVLLWDQGAARAVVLAREGEAGDWLGFDLTPEQFQARVAEVGHVPLPPYLERPDTPEDRARYQTVYAREEGAVAAPTAGLHFTPELLHELRALGVETREVILHVGPGTFRPVKADEVQEHRMDPEPYGIPPATAAAVNAAKRAGRRVLAVGSTSLRTLESAWDRATDSLTPGPGVTRLYAYPPYDFRVCDGLLTNFHLPKSTLFMLICAYLAPGRTDGIQRGQALYAHAIQEHYRFYSYGDACLFI